MSDRYDAHHQWKRKRWKRQLMIEWAWGRPGYPCARCRKPIERGQRWDLGHPDGEVLGGPEHASCNRSAGARLRKSRPERDAAHAAAGDAILAAAAFRDPGAAR
jgi:hypothetical protein